MSKKDQAEAPSPEDESPLKIDVTDSSTAKDVKPEMTEEQPTAKKAAADTPYDEDIPELDQADDPLMQPTTPASPLPPTPKKKSKTWPLVTLVIVAVLAVGTGTYALMGIVAPVTEQNTEKEQDSAADTVESTESETTETDSDITEALEVFESAAQDEESTLNTDDSGLATDASNAAGTVGDSIDENTL